MLPGLVLVAAALLGMAAPAAYAQSQATTGVIQGIVTDAEQQPIPGVTVTVTNSDTGLTRTFTTDENGAFVGRLLPLGRYTVESSLVGFAPVRREGIVLNLGAVVDLPLQMQLESVSEAITVTADAPLVEVTQTVSKTTIDEKAIETIPVNGRDFRDLVLLTPTATSTQPDDPIRISVAGQRGINNNVQMDGADNNSTFFGEERGGTRQPYAFSQAAVREFVVVNSGYSAEFGRAVGAVINAVTKSGTNDFSGEVFGFFRDEALVSDQCLLENCDDGGLIEPTDFSQQQFGFALGGPIVQNTAFFFVNAEMQLRDQPIEIAFGTDDDENGQPDQLDELGLTLSDVQLPDGSTLADQSGRFTQTEDHLALLGKVDFNIGEANTLSVRVSRTDFESENGTSGSGNTSVSNNGLEENNTIAAVASLNTIFSENLLNEARFQFSREERPRGANTTDYPETVIRNFGNFGQNNFLPNGLDEDLIQFKDNVSLFAGAHDLKFGLDITRTKYSNVFCRFCGGVYTFAGIEQFIDGTPLSYEQAFDLATPSTPGLAEFTETFLALYVQDQWRLSDKLTLNLGLRWEGQWNPTPDPNNPLFAQDPSFPDGDVPDDLDNFGPRLGIAYQLDEKAVIRGGAGIYYAHTPSILTANAIGTNGIKLFRVPINPAPVYPNRVTDPGAIAAGRPDVLLFDDEFENARTLRANVGYERELVTDWSIGVEYVFAHTDNLERKHDINLGPSIGTDANGRPLYSNSNRPNPNFRKVIQFESTAESEYHGFVARVQKRFSQGFQFLASYTLGFNKDDDSNERSTSTSVEYADDQFNFEDEWSDSLLDQRHRFVASGTAELPLGFTLSGVYNIGSGFPFDATTGRDSNGDTYFSDRPYENGQPIERNSFRGEGFRALDLRLAKGFEAGGFELELIAEVFNVFNNENARLTFAEQVWGNDTIEQGSRAGFGEARTVPGRPRQAQLAFRIRR
jgi:hypothetical protein